MRMVVVLPAPLGPMNPYTSPRSSLIVSRLRAYRSPYILVRSRISIMNGARVSFRVTGRSRRGRADRDVDAHECCLVDVAGQRGPLGHAPRQVVQPQPAGRDAVLRDLLGPVGQRPRPGHQDGLVPVGRAPAA